MSSAAASPHGARNLSAALPAASTAAPRSTPSTHKKTTPRAQTGSSVSERLTSAVAPYPFPSLLLRLNPLLHHLHLRSVRLGQYSSVRISTLRSNHLPRLRLIQPKLPRNSVDPPGIGQLCL